MSTDHHGSYCEVKGKMILDRNQANDLLTRMVGMTKYKCPSCGHWHIGHKSNRMKRNKKPRR